MGQIIFLSQLFDPEPTAKGTRFLQRLQDHGIFAQVVTGFPNYPGGKIYPGYRKFWYQREVLAGVDTVRLTTYMSHDASAIRRILTYLSFYATSLFYLLFAARRSDLIYVYYPALSAGFSAISAKLFRRTPVILDIQDMWPDSLGASGMMKNERLLKVAHFLCGVLYRSCDHIIVQSPGFKTLLIERGVSPEKITVIFNWTDEIALPAVNVLPAGLEASDGMRFLFAGNMGAAQGLGALLEAACLVQRERSDVTFLLLGDGTDKPALQAQAAHLGLRNLRFLPRVPMSEVQAYLQAADVLMVHLKDDPLFRVTIPSKTQAYLHAGRPVLIAAPGDASDLVARERAGLVAQPEDPQDLAAKVLELAAMPADERVEMGKRGRRFYASNLSMTVGLDKTAAVIKAHWRDTTNSG